MLTNANFNNTEVINPEEVKIISYHLRNAILNTYINL